MDESTITSVTDATWKSTAMTDEASLDLTCTTTESTSVMGVRCDDHSCGRILGAPNMTTAESTNEKVQAIAETGEFHYYCFFQALMATDKFKAGSLTVVVGTIEEPPTSAESTPVTEAAT